MMKFVKLTSLTDAAIYLNPVLVRAVSANTWRDGIGAKIIFDDADQVLVKETPEQVVTTLENADRT
jgi:hypothetical protein